MSKAQALFAYLMWFFGPVADSIKGHVNLNELARAAIAAFLAGGGAQGMLAAISADLPSIVTSTDLSLATAAITFVLEVMRRFNQGTSLVVLKQNLVSYRNPSSN